MKTISGLLKPKSGEILYEGRNIAGLPPHEIVKRGLSHVPEGRMIFANLTVLENLHVASQRRGFAASAGALCSAFTCHR